MTDPRESRGGIDLPVLVALALVALPFDPRWIDFEQARRGLGICAAGVLALDLARRRERRWPPLAGLLGLLIGVFALRALFGTTNPWAALERVGHWAALGVFLVQGAQRSVERVLGSVAAVGTAVAAYGLAQAAGLDWPAGYADAARPVSTLANANVAGELAAVAFAAALALRPASSRGAVTATLAAIATGSHVALLGSAGPALAAAGAGVLAVLRAVEGPGWASGLRRLVAAGMIAIAGVAVAGQLAPTADVATDAAAPAETPLAEAAPLDRPDTTAVRVDVWRSSLDLALERPLTGQGAGQFRFEYPRVRSQDEIERTTFGRRFPTVVTTAHNDPLEITVDGGLPALVLYGAFVVLAAFTLLRRRARDPGLAPFAALVLAGLTRAPMWNAPAALAAFVVLGAALASGGRPRIDRSALARVAIAALGIALLWIGVRIPVAATAAARALAADLEPARLDTAIAWDGGEPRYRNLRIQAACGGVAGGSLVNVGRGELEAVAPQVDALIALDPHNTNALFLTAQLLHGGGHTDRAVALLDHVLALDPRHPRATQLLAVIQAESGDAEAAIATLFADPHPRLRERLAIDLGLLATAPRVAERTESRARLANAAAFVVTLDAVLAAPGAPETNAKVREFAGRVGPTDDRARVLLARQFQALDRADSAAALAPDALDLPPATRRLLDPVLAELAALPAWAALRRD